MRGRFVESVKNARWSMRPQEVGDGLESMVEFQVQYTYFFFFIKGQAVWSSGYECVYVYIFKVDSVGYVVFFDIFPKFGPVVARSWRKDLMQTHVFQNLV